MNDHHGPLRRQLGDGASAAGTRTCTARAGASRAPGRPSRPTAPSSPAVLDQDLGEFVIADAQGRPVGPIGDGASVVLFNFRGDRAIELSRAFEDDEFPHFDRGRRPDALFAANTRLAFFNQVVNELGMVDYLEIAAELGILILECVIAVRTGSNYLFNVVTLQDLDILLCLHLVEVFITQTVLPGRRSSFLPNRERRI